MLTRYFQDGKRQSDPLRMRKQGCPSVEVCVLHVCEKDLGQVEVCTCYIRGDVNMEHLQQTPTVLLNVAYLQSLRVFLLCTKILLLDNI